MSMQFEKYANMTQLKKIIKLKNITTYLDYASTEKIIDTGSGDVLPLDFSIIAIKLAK